MIDIPAMHSTAVEDASKDRTRLAPLLRPTGHNAVCRPARQFLKTEGIGLMRDFGSQDVETHLGDSVRIEKYDLFLLS